MCHGTKYWINFQNSARTRCCDMLSPDVHQPVTAPMPIS
ncbi:hypothetical protein BZL30_0886 [Mycobacterium kansasii]|uniref:Uncharacterized protein n=1 Tax=Mycobacterium kansasii TaxID=1768 RepID=A0A1V3XVJ5_MYCKA|nr:hypothetical protein BZL30_0886 [Mycobacterium kansasii]OOK83112.1 hypothetical protein BZL29_1006 [Mycobacterium kansasii]